MSNVVKSAFILFVATMISKVLGFFRDLVIGYVYGAGIVSDSYFAALNIMTIAFVSLLCVAIQSTYMPIYTSVESKEGKNKALKFTGNVINIIIILSIFISILGWFHTEPIVKCFALGFKGERLAITIQLTKIILFSVGIVCITYVLKSYLEIHDYFLITGLMPIPYNLSIIIAVLLSGKYGINMLAYGTVFAFFVQMIFLIPFCYKKKFKYKFNFSIKDKYIKQMGLAILPILVGASANQINSLVDKNLASTLPIGALSSLGYGYKLNIFVTGLFIATITSVIYPLFSKLGNSNNIKKLKMTLCSSINFVTLITMPISIGAFILAEPIVRILFEKGKFDASATIATSHVLAYYAIGMVATGFREVLVRVFYSLKDTKTPMKNSILCVTFNIIFNLILIKYLKAPGLALGSSISAILAAAFLMFSLRKKIGKLNGMSILSTIIKTFIAGIVMAIAVLFIFNRLNVINELLAFVLSVSIGAIVYGVLVLVLRVDSTDYIIDMVKSKLANR